VKKEACRGGGEHSQMHGATCLLVFGGGACRAGRRSRLACPRASDGKRSGNRASRMAEGRFRGRRCFDGAPVEYRFSGTQGTTSAGRWGAIRIYKCIEPKVKYS
jgi:hypothetical protein